MTLLVGGEMARWSRDSLGNTSLFTEFASWRLSRILEFTTYGIDRKTVIASLRYCEFARFDRYKPR